MKLGIIIDSSAGITKAEADKRKWGFLPLYLDIDGTEYADGVDLDSKKYYELLTLESKVRTSATPPGISEEIIAKASKENDYVIVYPLSKELSSQNNNLKIVAEPYKNVFVVDSKGVGYAITRDLEEIEKMAKSGSSWDEIKESVTSMTNDLFGVAAPETLNWLVKGGRASEGMAKMANLLKVVPLIAFQEGKLEKYGKGRVFSKVIAKFTKDLYSQFGDNKEYIIYHSNNSDIETYKSQMEEILKQKVRAELFPSVIVNHIGPGAVAIITRKKA